MMLTGVRFPLRWLMNVGSRYAEVDFASCDIAAETRSLHRRRPHDESAILDTVLRLARRADHGGVSANLHRQEPPCEISACSMERLYVDAC